MSYAILRFSKLKGGSIRAIEAHHERKKEAYASNPDIDKSKSVHNYHLIEPDLTYYREIENRTLAAKCKVRSNSVKLVDTLITSDIHFFKYNSEKEYFQRALEFISDKIGKENIVSAVVHLDEKTPHMHLCFVPLTTDNRLSAKEILGNKTKMSQWQDDFHAFMQQQYPALERGKPASETNRTHLPVRLFKEATALNSQLTEIQGALNEINILNASKKRDKAIALLNEWFPKASSFICEMEKLRESFDNFQEKEEKLKTEISTLQQKNTKQRNDSYRREGKLQAEKSKVEDTLNDYVNFVNSIPKSIYGKLYNNYQEQKLQEQQRQMEEEYEYEWDD